MEQLINTLEKLNQKYLLEEKILIVPSYALGRQLILTLVNKGLTLFNYQLRTIEDLVINIYNKFLNDNKKEIINNSTAEMILFNILNNLQDNNQLKYFANLQITSSINKVIYRTINELRLAGFKSIDLEESYFVSKKKAKDIKIILHEYEQRLVEDNFLSVTDVYQQVLSFLKSKTDIFNSKIMIIPANFRVKYLEKQILDIIMLKQKDRYIFSFTDIPGITRAESFYIKDESSACSFFDYLYDIANCGDVKKPKIVIKKAYGESNEVKEVFRQLKANNIPFDQAVIICTIAEPYSQLVYDIACKDDLPVTFASGINIKNTSPGKLYLALLQWIKEDYSEQGLRLILNSGFFSVKKELGVSKSRIAKRLRQLGIGYSQERYIQSLKRKIEEYMSKEDHESYSYRIDELKNILGFIEDLFTKLPSIKNGSIDTKSFINGLEELIKKNSRILGDIDIEARQIIIEKLEKSIPYLDNLQFDKLLQFLVDLIENERVGHSTAKAGHLHICSYRQGLHIKREHNFVLGLDSNKFPSQGLEDPILLDVERKRLGNLELKRDKQKIENYEMSRLLKSLNNNIYLSYPCFDIIEYRENTAAAILLQVYRLLTRDNGADYSDLVSSIDKTAEFIGGNETTLLDEAEYWLYAMFKENGIKDTNILIKDIYKDIYKGIKASIKRKEGFNQFNGKIDVISEEIDPRDNEYVFSASKLELIARCPYGYFLRYILNIKLPDEFSYELGIWLDPLARGSLLHEIFECFYQKISSLGEKPSLDKHLNLLFKIAEEKIVEKKKEIPVPSDTVFEIEREELLQSCRVFLASEEENCDGQASFFELAFGFKNKEAVEINLGEDKKIKIRGYIDRVDKVNDNTYNIIDYKTGSTYGYAQRDYFKAGRQLQHALYALALEQILPGNITVDKAGYIFPSLKGEGQRFMRQACSSNSKREDVKEIINILLDMICLGNFVMTADDSDCKYCDYKLICEVEIMVPIMKELKENLNQKDFDHIRRLDTYV